MGRDELTRPLSCSVGIMAHNEEANIGHLLEAVLAQRTPTVRIAEIVVVASGCTDGTVGICREWQGRDPRVDVLVQPRREGKASAVNLFLSRARAPVLVLCSADLLPAPDTIEQVVAPFADPDIGMTTCRPVPVDAPDRFMGFAAHLLWNLHHEINLKGFKAGELVAFRKIFERIPYRTSVDEARIEPVIRGQGYGVRYVPTAVTYNKGPETVHDFLSQRRRIFAGHLAMRDELGYRVRTLSSARILALLVRHMDWRPRAFCWTVAVAALEAYGRLLGRRDYRAKREHVVWEIATTTKRLEAAAAREAEGVR
ncbi:glycosyltransferase [Anaeromyxobacter terrae]|uniref:glycosyltransferase n=1 Tax=Anaeromyxobacter terrae TaxID=2925406 RepID=UPI002436C387|nr:glycosyltransferase [Anaeromyxobacter sp. SG22]